MLLRMYLNKIFIAKHEFDFVEMDTMEERDRHLRNLRDSMYWDNWNKIKFTGREPVFFYEQPSRMNDFVFGEYEFEFMSWADVKMHYQLKTIEDGNCTEEKM